MSTTEHSSGLSATDRDQAAEIAGLRARIAELEEQLIEVEAWANRTVAAAQERLYWLDRWQIDLNAMMRRPGANQFRAAIRSVRGVYRLLLVARRRFRGA
jgi:hypothetical protein